MECDGHDYNHKTGSITGDRNGGPFRVFFLHLRACKAWIVFEQDGYEPLKQLAFRINSPGLVEPVTLFLFLLYPIVNFLNLCIYRIQIL